MLFFGCEATLLQLFVAEVLRRVFGAAVPGIMESRVHQLVAAVDDPAGHVELPDGGVAAVGVVVHERDEVAALERVKVGLAVALERAISS
jgi:hypothetical protein